MIAAIRQLFCAAQFLTILPIPGNWVKEPGDLSKSMRYYPLVGLLIGALECFCYLLASRIFPTWLSVVMTFSFGILLTGGLHLDGFADMCDGFYAGKNRAEILSIMKDPHVGTMAILGLFCLLTLKLALLYAVVGQIKLLAAFYFVPSLSRWVMTVSASLFSYGRSEAGTAQAFVEGAGKVEIFLSALFMAVIAYGFFKFQGLCIAGLILGFCLLCARFIARKLEGVTGDVLGALNELAETAALMALAGFMRGPA